ncbi:MAG: ABC transporter ATP-binding protein [Proteobacteria bacterium]|nr:ABC transporter ATP-binding protein [Pseudomonadota bacterium]MBU1641549.1 ABC transporter ATP-binding protein [Pseudomonadota bacterium]
MLEINDLSISFSSYSFGLRKTETCAIRSLDLTITPGQIMAVVGQSGGGKSLLAHALLGILPRNARVTGGMLFKGEPLTIKRQAALRGRQIALIPQSMTYLNPLVRVGNQVAQAARLGGVPGRESKGAVSRAFTRYRLNQKVISCFPFQLSGGMARRVLTATATVGGAELILADEPTSGLDPASSGETLAHLRELADSGKAVLLITHDIEAALKVADSLTVFCGGVTLEVAAAGDFSSHGVLRHPYTRALWGALPGNDFVGAVPAAMTIAKNGGCPFSCDCPKSDTVCNDMMPELKRLYNGLVRCHYA